jgi:hypothetical protein
VSATGTVGATNYSQVGYLLNEVDSTAAPAPSSAGIVATSAPLTTNPAVNLTGVNLTLTNLSVTALNPDMTSSSAAIADTQVNADAYLVPSTTDLLDDHLGKSTMPSLTNVTNLTTQNSPAYIGQPSNAVVNYPAGRSGSAPRQSATPITSGSNQSSSSSMVDFVEPFEPAGPTEPPQGQPGPQGEPGPPSTTTPQTPSQGSQATPSAAAPETTTPGGQAPSQGPDAAPEAAPQGQQGSGSGSGSGTAQLEVSPSTRNSEVDSALELVDARVLTRSRYGDTAPPTDDSGSEIKTTWSLSAIFGAAAAATGGYHLLMGNATRLPGRSFPRWLGAERPTRRKTAPGAH